MPKPTVTMVAKRAKRYNRAYLVPGKTFQARPGDAQTLRLLGWAKDPPAPKGSKEPKVEPIKADTYLTADLQVQDE